jgi:uncharacterized protein
MPTNILRDRATAAGRAAAAARQDQDAGADANRIVVITAGRCVVRAALLPTPNAGRLWEMLPLFSTIETWGDLIHAETPVKAGRERTAKINGRVGELYFWSEESRLMIPFGPTPISRANEIRLPCPCNVIGHALDDVGGLRALEPGEKLSIVRDVR